MQRRLSLVDSRAPVQALPPLLLDRAAQPGVLGFVRDAVHVLAGERRRMLLPGQDAA